MNEPLKNALQEHIQSGWRSNLAMRQIVDDYARFHAVLAITGGMFLLLLAWLAIRLFVRSDRLGAVRRFPWTFEKAVYFGFGSVLSVTALLLAVVVVANTGTAANPLPGFSGSLGSIADSNRNRELHKAFENWIASSASTPPALIQQHIHQRRLFHSIRAIGGFVLFLTFAIASLSLWGALIRMRNAGDHRWTFKEVGWLGMGIALVPVVLFLMVVVIANTQGAVVPLANTLQFG
jgi:hypothetical protein